MGLMAIDIRTRGNQLKGLDMPRKLLETATELRENRSFWYQVRFLWPLPCKSAVPL